MTRKSQEELEQKLNRLFRIDQCTVASESPPILLRRMEVQIVRLVRVEALIRAI
jgi:hypothetical protein